MKNYLQSLLSDQPLTKTAGETPQFFWREVCPGGLELIPRDAESSQGLIISAGIHGNETAPVEILNELLDNLFSGSLRLSRPLLLIFGNLPALQAGSRFTGYDLNRLFSASGGQVAECYETARVKQLEAVCRDFQARLGEHCGWHLDLHTAIRGSIYTQFGMLPASDRRDNPDFLGWLEAAGLQALVFHRTPSGTFSHFTCNSLQMESCTLELGKARPFGSNRLQDFALAVQALRAIISGKHNLLETPSSPARRFRVAQQITRHSEDFILHMSEDTVNFTEFNVGALLAEDGAHQYWVLAGRPERVLFPNPRVAVGLRAGLMLVEEDS